jgi:genome maintenance exonuclease 1
VIVLPKIEQINTVSNGRFYRTPEGNIYPSVTSVLGSVKDDSLEEWRKAVGEVEANKVSQRATARGNRIHKYAENYLLNRELEYKSIFDKAMFQPLIPQLNRISELQGVELGLYSDFLEVAGTTDIVGRFGKKKSIIDLKTANRFKYKSEIEGYFIQTAVYAVCWEERTKEPITQLVVLIAVESDEPQVFIEHRDNWIDSFISIRKNYESVFRED